jgi:hypothetical protein
MGVVAAGGAAARADEAAPSTSDRIRAADARVVRQSKVIGAAVKKGARQVGAVAKKMGHEVADASVKGAHEVRDTAKEFGAKTRAAMRKPAS